MFKKYIHIKDIIYHDTIKDDTGKVRRPVTAICICGTTKKFSRLDRIKKDWDCGCISNILKEETRIKKAIEYKKRIQKEKELKKLNPTYILRQKEINEKREMKKHKLFFVWQNIKRRCNSKTHPKYHLYGALGVTMCNEWLTDYYSFYKWAINNGYKEGLQLDKDILCDKLNIYPKIYSPSTCKWVTLQENISVIKRKGN